MLKRGTALFRLAKGQVGSFWLNSRFSYSSGQYYRQHCINMAYVDDLDPNVLINTKPTRFADMLANIF